MNKLNQLARHFLGWRLTPAAPAAAPAEPSPSQPPAADPAPEAAVAPAPEAPLPPWRAASRVPIGRFFVQVTDLPDGQGYLVLRVNLSECRRTLMTPLRLPLPGTVCLAGSLFSLGDTRQPHVCGQGDQAKSVERNFRYVLPPILYTSASELEAIRRQTRQEVTRLLESCKMPSLPDIAPVSDGAEALPEQMPPEWLDLPPLEGPPPQMEMPSSAPEVEVRPHPASQPDGRRTGQTRFKKEWVGTIIEFRPRGTIMVRGEEKQSPVLYFHDEALGGGKNSVSGTHLREAMALSHAGPGDRVRIRHMENVPVDSDQPDNRQGRRGKYMKLFEIDVLEKWQPPAE